MVRSYKNAEKFMNSPADASAATALCRDGVIARADFLEAAAFGCDEAAWRRRFQKTLFVCGVLFFVSAAFCASLAFRRLLFSFTGFCAAFSAFAGVCLLCLKKEKASVFQSCLGVGLICFLIFMPDPALGFDASPAVQFLYGALLSGLFAFMTGRCFPLAAATVLLNASLYCAASRFCAPSGRFSFETLLIGAAMLNASALAVCERVLGDREKMPLCLRRAVLLCLSAIPFLIALRGETSAATFVFSTALYAAAWTAYAFARPDSLARRLSASAFCVWLIVTVWRLLPFARPSDWRAFAVFGLVVFGLTAAGSELCRIFDARDGK